MRNAILYSDFNCPFCYALEERLAALHLGGHVEWRGVEHAPGLPIPMRATPESSRDLSREVRIVQQLAPEASIAVPPGKPNTHLAERAVASAFLLDRKKATRFKENVYRAFWTRGDDISQTEVLETLAQEAGFDALPANGTIDTVLYGWREDWLESSPGAVPFLIAEDGQYLSGLCDPATLAGFFAGVEAPLP